jgi:hypothetical protein
MWLAKYRRDHVPETFQKSWFHLRKFGDERLMIWTDLMNHFATHSPRRSMDGGMREAPSPDGEREADRA